MIVRAIILIDDDRIKDLCHNNISKSNVSCKSIAGSRPCFDPYTILSSSENWICYCHIFYTIFSSIGPKAANAARETNMIN